MQKNNPYSKKNWSEFKPHILRQWYLLDEDDLDKCKSHEAVAVLVSKHHSISYELALEGLIYLEELIFTYSVSQRPKDKTQFTPVEA